MYERNIRKTCCQTYFKLIFMDYNMPVMEGPESAQNIFEKYAEVSQLPEYSHIVKPVIIAMTAANN